MSSDFRPLIPVNTEGLESVADRLFREVKVQDHPDFWRVSGVNYRSGVYTVDLLKTLLDNGAERTQDEWAMHYQREKAEGRFYTPNIPLLYGLLKALYAIKDDMTVGREVADINRLLTGGYIYQSLTRIRHCGDHRWVCVHNYGTNDNYEVPATVAESKKDGITNTPRDGQEILGTDDDVQQIMTIFQWFYGKDLYINRKFLNYGSATEKEVNCPKTLTGGVVIIIKGVENRSGFEKVSFGVRIIGS